MVLVHGMFGQGEPWYWDNYRQFFTAEGYSVTTPTLPLHNFHHEDLANPDFLKLAQIGMIEYVQAIEAHITDVGAAPVLMGHSMGGLVSMLIASRAKVKIRSLLPLTPATPHGILALQPTVLKTFGRVMLDVFHYHRPFKLTDDEAVYSMYHLLNSSKQRNILDHLVYESSYAARQIAYHLFYRSRPTKLKVENLRKIPRLIVSAEYDRITPPEVNYRTSKLIKSDLMFLANHAHGMLWEDGWEDVCAKILTWLKQVDAKYPDYI